MLHAMTHLAEVALSLRVRFDVPSRAALVAEAARLGWTG